MSTINNNTKEISNVAPSDFYSFLLHKLTTYFKNKINDGEITDTKTNGSYERLNNFIWNRAHVKNSIMTMPYNSSFKSMNNYVADSLTMLDRADENRIWYTTNERSDKAINDRDISLLITCLKYIIDNDFHKIKKLSKYLKNVATLINLLELPITWTLSTGLSIKQSYLETNSLSLTPFMYSKIKVNLIVTIRDKYDFKKQVRALMPNLINSLDGTSLSLLYEQYINTFCCKKKKYVIYFYCLVNKTIYTVCYITYVIINSMALGLIVY